MSVAKKLKISPGLMGIAGLGLAALVSACGQGDGSEQQGAENAGVETRVAEAREATSENIDAKSKVDMGDAGNPCGGCNPCAAAACNPCAAEACNPCAAVCNPCAADACNPCAAEACNPCGAACNPCGGCNPCAAEACNPCGAACNPCGGCNPCAGSAGPTDLSADDLKAAYNALKAGMRTAYGASDASGAADYQGWQIYNTRPYTSATHGGRFVNNYANEAAASYSKFEDAGVMPVGAILAKDSLTFAASGKAAAGPLFLMEKMDPGFDAENGDWKYSLVLPNGTTWGVTGGKNSGGMKFCSDCHIAVADYDYLFFLPDDYRVE